MIEKLRKIDWDQWVLVTEDDYRGKNVATTPEEAAKLLLPPKFQVLVGNVWEVRIAWINKGSASV